MFFSSLLIKNRFLLKNVSCAFKPMQFPKVVNCPNVMSNEELRNYSKKKDKGAPSCRRALVDIPPEGDPKCPEKIKPKKKGVLHKIKLKIIEGGTNFGTPFRRLLPQKPICEEPEEEEEDEKPKALPAPVQAAPEEPEVRPGVQVSILGADSSVGQYTALLLKQCPCIKRLRLYQSSEQGCCLPFGRDLYQVVQDLQYIDTSCQVQAYSCRCCELNLCLQNSDIVLMLDCPYTDSKMSVMERFNYQAPMVKQFADAMAHECPRAFVIVCASPVECMVPIVAETYKETGWYDRRKLLGSVAIPEMRASTLAARTLALDPELIRVPCVGGTEGTALVPLFSKAIDYFEFSPSHSVMMTRSVRDASAGCCLANPELSEAHALAGLVKNVALALLCEDRPRVSGFVETDNSQVISPARFLTTKVELNRSGICENEGLPLLSETELHQMTYALVDLEQKLYMACNWYCKYRSASPTYDYCRTQWWFPRELNRFKDCAYASVS